MDNVIENNLGIKQVLEYAKDLNKTVASFKTALQELKDSYLDTVLRLVMAAEYKR